MTRTANKPSERDVELAIESLRELVPEGSTLLTILMVWNGGARRHYAVYHLDVDDKGRPYARDLSRLTARALGQSENRTKTGYDVVAVNGQGLDTSLVLVESISQAIHGDPHKLSRAL